MQGSLASMQGTVIRLTKPQPFREEGAGSPGRECRLSGERERALRGERTSSRGEDTDSRGEVPASAVMLLSQGERVPSLREGTGLRSAGAVSSRSG